MPASAPHPAVVEPRHLHVLGPGAGYTMWRLRTPHDHADLLRPGYFDAMTSLLDVGDSIAADCAIDTPRRRRERVLLVTAIDGDTGAVEVTDAELFGAAEGEA